MDRARRAGAVLGALCAGLAVAAAGLVTGPVGAPLPAPAGWVRTAGGGLWGPGERLPPPWGVPPPPVRAGSAILLDVASARVLYARRPYRRVYGAAPGPLLTALAVARAEGDRVAALARRVTLTPRMLGRGATADGLAAGRRVSLAQLLGDLLHHDDPRAARALAFAVAGGPRRLALLADAAARAAGAEATAAADPAGAPSPWQYTTAYDTALIARAALVQPAIAGAVAALGARAGWSGGRGGALGGGLPHGGALGAVVPSGAGTVVVTATRGGLRLVAVVAGVPAAAARREADRLLAWGLETFDAVALVPPGYAPAESQVAGGVAYAVDAVAPSTAPAEVAAGPAEPVALRAPVPAVLAAPVRRGQLLGWMTLDVDGQPFGRWPLRAAWSVPARAGTGREPA